MKTQVLVALSLMTLASARPTQSLRAREVPLEHSHEKYLTSVRTSLNLDNPDNISDPVFGLLGNAAAAAGKGNIADTECLQQATADQAFTNAKAAGNTQGQIDALIYQALERNTGSVGLKSNSCTSIQPVNAEIAAIQRHQDPASDGAADINKASTLAVAQGIQSLGGDVTQALDAGTFAPGTIGDPTAKGNTCDDENDPEGCIFTQNLLVQDFTADELTQALASAGGAAAGGNANAGGAAAANGTADAGANAGGNAAAGNANDGSADECDASGNAAAGAADSGAANADSGNATASSGNAASGSGDAAAGAAAGGAATGAASDLGSCTSAPTITFGPGNDGRTEDSFAFDKSATDFNHGSALNIKVLTGFAVQQLTDSCKAGAAAVSAAQAAATAANGQTGQAAADTWNAAFQ